MARLVRESDRDEEVTARTVHYYTQVGILPPAMGRGRGAFSPEHLARFRLARQLRREGKSLADIRTELDSLSRKDVAKLTSRYEESLTPSLDAELTALKVQSEYLASAARMTTKDSRSPRTLRFRGGFALQVPASVADDAAARIYAAVERVIEKEVPMRARRPRQEGDSQ